MSDQSSHPREAPRATRLVVQGEYDVSDDGRIVFTTLLGSCVATCLCDPVAGVGGMNHFLLAGRDGEMGNSERYGSYAMEVLINALLKLGARKSRLEAKLFGGATMGGGIGRIGAANCVFARDYLNTEKIPLVSSSLGGERARRLRYRPSTGQAQMLFVTDAIPAETAPPRVAVGDVDLF